MDFLLIGSIILHVLINTFGVFFNAILIFLVLKRTPKKLSTYASLILNFAIFDLFTCIAALFVQQRYSFMLHCYAHSLWSLLFSFAYRYYILVCSPPKIHMIRIIILIIYIPSFLQFVTFCFASDNADIVRERMHQIFGYDTSEECVSGHLNILTWTALFTILHVTLPVTPVYAAILVLRRSVAIKIRKEKGISENTRHLHTQLLKALSYQACIPLLFLFAVVTYALGQLKIMNHPALEYSTFIFAGCIPMLCPLTPLHFIRPYHSWVTKTLLRGKRFSFALTEARVSTITRSYQQ